MSSRNIRPLRLLSDGWVLRGLPNGGRLQVLVAIHRHLLRGEVGLQDEAVPHGSVAAAVLANGEEDEGDAIREHFAHGSDE